jgi:hypothetical protein
MFTFRSSANRVNLERRLLPHDLSGNSKQTAHWFLCRSKRCLRPVFSRDFVSTYPKNVLIGNPGARQQFRAVSARPNDRQSTAHFTVAFSLRFASPVTPVARRAYISASINRANRFTSMVATAVDFGTAQVSTVWSFHGCSPTIGATRAIPAVYRDCV